MIIRKAPVSSLEEWLSTASSGLCDYAVHRIRTEITDHYSAAIDAGQTPEAALASLGNPKNASRNYRKVYPTPTDLLVAGNPIWFWFECIASVILVILPMQAAMFITFPSPLHVPVTSVDRVIVLVLSSIHLVFHCFIRRNSARRARNYLWLSVAQVVAIGFLIGPWRVLAMIFLLVPYASMETQCLQFHRRIGNMPLPKPDPSLGEMHSDQLTERDVLFLQFLRQPLTWCDRAPYVTALLIGAVCTWFWPWIAGPLTLYVAYALALPRFVPINTPERGRLFRRTKWFLFTATAVVSLLSFLLFTPETRYPVAAKLLAWGVLSIVLGAVAPTDRGRERLRRKLPVDQWPERLY